MLRIGIKVEAAGIGAVQVPASTIFFIPVPNDGMPDSPAFNKIFRYVGVTQRVRYSSSRVRVAQ